MFVCRLSSVDQKIESQNGNKTTEKKISFYNRFTLKHTSNWTKYKCIVCVFFCQTFCPCSLRSSLRAQRRPGLSVGRFFFKHLYNKNPRQTDKHHRRTSLFVSGSSPIHITLILDLNTLDLEPAAFVCVVTPRFSPEFRAVWGQLNLRRRGRRRPWRWGRS